MTVVQAVELSNLADNGGITTNGEHKKTKPNISLEAQQAPTLQEPAVTKRIDLYNCNSRA